MTAFLLTGGIISDRVERRRVLIAADLARAAVLAVTGALTLAGVLKIWHLVAPAVLMSSRVPPELRGRVHSRDWFVSIGLTPVSFALTGPVSKAIGVDTTLVVAGAAPMLVCVVLYVSAGLRRDEELHPLLPAPAIR